ncbi:MAG TPA: hypothetical protein VMD57_02095, partial [Candidatus Baltobacteraceae bacterium]|nr:hypothetical protein [Candidatus Baltobacteraceae bacterium]
MSLIADALKRARGPRQENPPDAPPLMPTPNARTGFSWHFPALIILLFVAVGIFIGLAIFGRAGQKMAVAGKISAPQTEFVEASTT